MKLSTKETGFTIIETLVAINIMFFAISLMFSFYLFVQKFSKTLTENYVGEYELIKIFSAFDKTLNYCEHFDIVINNNDIIITTNTEDSIFISNDSLSINGIFSISSIQNLDLTIIGNENEEITKKSFEKSDETFTSNNPILLHSTDVYLIILFFEVNEKENTYRFYQRANSAKRFMNFLTQTSPAQLNH